MPTSMPTSSIYLKGNDLINFLNLQYLIVSQIVKIFKQITKSFVQWLSKPDLYEGGAKYYPHSIDQSIVNLLFIKSADFLDTWGDLWPLFWHDGVYIFSVRARPLVSQKSVCFTILSSFSNFIDKWVDYTPCSCVCFPWHKPIIFFLQKKRIAPLWSYGYYAGDNGMNEKRKAL